jgi:hypothetical protein
MAHLTGSNYSQSVANHPNYDQGAYESLHHLPAASLNRYHENEDDPAHQYLVIVE